MLNLCCLEPRDQGRAPVCLVVLVHSIFHHSSYPLPGYPLLVDMVIDNCRSVLFGERHVAVPGDTFKEATHPILEAVHIVSAELAAVSLEKTLLRTVVEAHDLELGS